MSKKAIKRRRIVWAVEQAIAALAIIGGIYAICGICGWLFRLLGVC